MAGEWILEEPPWWTRFQRATWLIAMRLRYGLEVNPAIGKNLSKRCLAKKCSGSYCLEPLDAHGQHAQVCHVEGATIHRHDTVRDGLQPGLRRYVTNWPSSTRTRVSPPKLEWTSSQRCQTSAPCLIFGFSYRRESNGIPPDGMKCRSISVT